MKHFLPLCLFLGLSTLTMAQPGTTFHSFKVKDIHGDSISLSQYAGKKLLVVNTASFCGYTHQFAKLQQLDSAYQQYNFRVIGFPCNDFGGQDPYADSTIETFCTNQYAVAFPMMSKVSIRVGDTSKVYKWLQKKSWNGVANVSVDWNFNKFLVDAQGNWVRRYASPIEPTNPQIIAWILAGVTGGQELLWAQSGLNVSTSNQKIDLRFPENQATGQIRVLSLDGKVILQEPVQSGTEVWSSGLVKPGFYMVEFQTEEAAYRKKVMVQF